MHSDQTRDFEFGRTSKVQAFDLYHFWRSANFGPFLLVSLSLIYPPFDGRESKLTESKFTESNLTESNLTVIGIHTALFAFSPNENCRNIL